MSVTSRARPLAPGSLKAGLQRQFVHQELSQQLSDCGTLGLRFEWFDDVDGFIVNPTPGPGVYYDLTLGLNYKLNSNLIVRPEIER